MTQSSDQQDEMYERLISISRQAFADQEYEVAYHTLVATMHHSMRLKNTLPLLRKVLIEAADQQKTLDTLAPEHRLSTFTASRHGHRSVYETLQKQLMTRIQLLETEPLSGKRE